MNFADSMNFTETLLSKKMQEAEPALDIFGSDQKVVQIAFQDFMNYVKFNWKLEKSSNCVVIGKIEHLYKADPVEFESFLNVWVGLWFRKWRSRVRLLLGKQSQGHLGKVSETLSKAEPLWGKLSCRREMVELLVSALIRNAEICGTSIVAEHLLKIELGKQENQNITGREQVFAVLTNALCKAREMAQGVGPMLFVKVDNNYFGAAKN